MKYILVLTAGMIAFLLYSGVSVSQEQSVQQGSIIVTIKGIKHTQGQIRACLFNQKEGFPDKPEKALRIMKSIIPDSANLVLSFNTLSYGEYAVAILHDEDSNGEMKTGLFGIPKEGYGISNNAKGVFGPPSFKDSKIYLQKRDTTISISMNY